MLSLLRGDILARYKAYALGRNWGWLSVNQIRQLENMNTIPEGNVFLQPSNMQPAGSMMMDQENPANQFQQPSLLLPPFTSADFRSRARAIQ